MDLYTMAVMWKPTTVGMFLLLKVKTKVQTKARFIVSLCTVDLVRLGFTLQFGKRTMKV